MSISGKGVYGGVIPFDEACKVLFEEGLTLSKKTSSDARILLDKKGNSYDLDDLVQAVTNRILIHEDLETAKSPSPRTVVGECEADLLDRVNICIERLITFYGMADVCYGAYSSESRTVLETLNIRERLSNIPHKEGMNFSPQRGKRIKTAFLEPRKSRRPIYESLQFGADQDVVPLVCESNGHSVLTWDDDEISLEENSSKSLSQIVCDLWKSIIPGSWQESSYE